MPKDRRKRRKERHGKTMICEKCKSKKATLFYADESGDRHALCESCGDSINKIGALGEKKSPPPTKYIPERTLFAFCEVQGSLLPYIKSKVGSEVICSACGGVLEKMIDKGRFSCPLCYECFEQYISLPYRREKDVHISRMPSSRRADIDRQKALEMLRADIRVAVENDNYELAASLRDKMKKLECSV